MAEVPVRLHPEAEEEANDARAWYAERRPRIYGRYRRFPMHRFPFNVVYLERRGFIAVIAVAHFRRRPGYWRAR